MTQGTAWILLILAGLLDAAWAVSMKYADGYTRFGWTVVSLLLLAVIVGWCVRSYVVKDNISYRWSQDDGTSWASQWRGVAIGRGGLFCYECSEGPLTGELYENVHRANLNTPPGWLWVKDGTPTDPRRWESQHSTWERLGFIHRVNLTYSGWMKDRSSHWILPIWPFALVVSLPLLPWLLKLRRRSGRAGHCRQCGYDLRATPDRCPECGAVVETRQPAQ